MPKTTSQLPAGTANRNAVVAADNASATLTEKITLGDIASLASYRLSATTSGTTPAVLAGDSLALEVGEAWQFEIKLVARNRKTDGTKVWSIRGGIRKSFGGAVALVGSLDTQTTGSIGGGSVSVTAQPAGLTITVAGVANTNVDWQATILTSEKTSTQQALVGGCTDPDVGNYNALADFDNGTCSYSAVPSSSALEPVASEDEIESLTVTVGANELYPAFDPVIKDYYVKTSAAYLGNASYEIVINEGTPITGTIKAGRTLQINDGVSYYYVRVLPSDVAVGTVSFAPTEGYVPGYYLAARPVSGGATYYYIYDHRGVPFWYGKSGTTTPVSGHVGKAENRLVLNPTTGDGRAVLRLNSASQTRTAHLLAASPSNGSLPWGIHETLELAAPASRFGNLVGSSYYQGFYIQEQNASGELIWEWHSKDYFASQDVEFYHLNSVDIHPTNGNVLVSLRNCSAVLCIDYTTKEVLWVLQGDPSPSYGTLQSQAIPGMCDDTQWLTVSGEPSVDGFQYDGPRAQHDARWRTGIAPLTAGNEVISLYDNQSETFFGFTSTGAAPSARAVIYEINLTSGTAIHRDSIYAEDGTSSHVGSYKIMQEGEQLTHSVNFSTHHPPLIEFSGAVGAAKTKLFAMDLDGDIYRIIKVPLSQFRADNLRATCGVNVDTGALPAGGGGGGGGSGTALLLHFDGTNGSTTFTDSSANSLAVTADSSATISTAQHKFGGASGYFDTTAGGLTVAGAESLQFSGTPTFTIEAWIRPNAEQAGGSVGGGNAGGIVSSRNSAVYANYELSIRADLGLRVFASDFPGNWAYIGSSSSLLAADQWSHVALVCDGGTLNLYVNGVLDETVAGAAVSFGGYGDGVVYIAQGGDGVFYGYIDELRIVNGTAVYTDDFTPPTAPFTT